MTVMVRLKRDMLDPEVETTKRALERLGFEPEALRFTERYEVNLDAADTDEAETRANGMVECLLANPAIHDYEIAVAET